VSDLLIAGNETIATVADALTPDTPQQLIEKKGLAITVAAKSRADFILNRTLYIKINEKINKFPDVKEY